MIPATEIIVPVALFAMVFGIVYVVVTARHRQRMALIEKGMDPGLGDQVVPMRGLRNGLFLVGVGLGLLLGYALDKLMRMGDAIEGDNALPYFVMVLLCGGLALVLHHLIVQRKQRA